ncbi:SET [Glarea lozoyensis ATCC 20868]|uniref:SET n=2 Tax=Glarea lozoyensis TaxID=101852 RepID=S3DIV5_GLAL2|nr:SET [Glarea lozoyensis ATCC 20868]EHK96408.1 putative protein lysine methyltransferase SET5 [Glarea lozoyensis 74030]EPE37089.1 SET [Glarea lozoyensis ATCC 20868]
MDSSDEEDNTPYYLERRETLTAELRSHPYDLILYLERAQIYSELGYPDLSAGDAYRALLLHDECATEEFEYHEQATEALQEWCADGPGGTWQLPAVLRSKGGVHQLVSQVERVDLNPDPKLTVAKQQSNGVSNGVANGELDGEGNVMEVRMEKVLKNASLRCYRNLSISLLLCGCLKSSYDFCQRGLTVNPGDEELEQAKEYIQLIAKRRLKVKELDYSQLPDQGLVRREIYPWNDHEPDRYSAETLAFLNKELAKCAPKCEAKVTELPILFHNYNNSDNYGTTPTMSQLGLFAKEDIEPGEEILDEFSLLAANNVLKDALCDACSSALPPLTVDSEVVACPDCDDIMFCNSDCFERAQASYHPAVCEKDIDTVAKDPDPKEKPFALYLLLLGRALAMAVTQETHPLDLTEVKYIWGDFLPSSQNAIPLPPDSEPPPIWTLPFSFSSNIAGPLHLLEKMDIDIFQNLDHYDLWVFNTLYAKFRGTASARVNHRTGHPEVAAVHPLWCLANHDCDPNVQWEWGARMRFWCREKRIDGSKGGVKKGEEILNHYTDVELGVKERREWAKGSLGGFCMCERCKREAGEAIERADGSGQKES